MMSNSQQDNFALINRSKAIAAMGLVGKVNDTYNVTSPGFRKEVFRVWQTAEGHIKCSCVIFQEQSASNPIFRCEHILAVKYHLEAQDGAAPKEFGSDIVASSPGVVAFSCGRQEDGATPRQRVAIRAISNSQKIDADTKAKEMFQCDVDGLTRRQASKLIDELKSIDSLDEDDAQAVEVLKKFTQAVHAKHNNNHELARRVFYEAQRLWQRWEEETSVLRKPQPRSSGAVKGIEW